MSSPIVQLKDWLTQISQVEAHTAMALACVDKDGSPSVRIVLFKGFRDEDLMFFTNLESRKSGELANNPAVAAVFYWAHLERQLRIEGKVEKLAREENERYFRTRPREAQIGAWASPQSQPIGGRAELEQRVETAAARFGEGEVPCPPHWGGFAIKISAIEFWQAGEARLHTRNRFDRVGATWRHQILAP